jgi:hypothetical protein
MWGFRSNRLAIGEPQPKKKVRLLVEEDGHGHRLGEEEGLRSCSDYSGAKKGLKLGSRLDSM